MISTSNNLLRPTLANAMRPVMETHDSTVVRAIGNSGDITPPDFGSVGDWTGQGCFTDYLENRILPDRFYVPGGMTIEKCIEACSSNGYSYAGVEFANECYCGNGIAPWTFGAAIGCTMVRKSSFPPLAPADYPSLAMRRKPGTNLRRGEPDQRISPV
ncbi:hypothetical protein FRC17_007582 [Serendipita sp. 399]|nr:hypothetical protein FRC17_007582 [Serendipita sp. 399]